jgi:hypothetical protein
MKFFFIERLARPETPRYQVTIIVDFSLEAR